MDLSSDSDDCHLYTRAASNIAIKKKLLDGDREELALRMKFLPDDQVPGFSYVFNRLDDSSEPTVVSDSEDEIPLSELRKSLKARLCEKRIAASLPKFYTNKSRTKSLSNDKASNSSNCTTSLCVTQPNNVNEIPTIILDDDTGYSNISFEPINFNSHSNKNRTDNDDDSIIASNALQANYDDENYEDLDTLVKISVDWRNNAGVVGWNIKHFQLRRYQNFETVFEELGKMEGLPINRVVIMRNFETIRPRDTPASLNLTYYGHLVGMISKTEFDHSLPKLSELDDDYKKPPEGELKVKLLLDSKTSLSLSIFKTQKMYVLYKKCSEELKIPDYNIKITFDGEIVQQQDTVSDLDIEDGDVFHVLMKTV